MVSGSFLALQRLRASFDGLRDDEAELLDVAAGLGAIALPLCHRHFAADGGAAAEGDGGGGAVADGAAGERERRAAWAHALLFHLARDPDLKGRIVVELEALTQRARASDRSKLRAIALLAELGAEPPDDASLADPESARLRSSRDLALCLGSPADVARAGDHLLDPDHGMSERELLDLFDDLIEADPGAALLLVEELLVRDEIDDTCRHELRQRRAAARQLAPAASPPRWRRRPSDALSCRAAPHRDGRRVLLVCERQPGSRPPRRRALCALVSPRGLLLDAHYAEDLTLDAVESELVAPLEREGFALASVPLDTARGFLIEAARQAVRSGHALPRPFYLGRHVLGLHDEHLEGTARAPAAVDLAALLDRAIGLVARGEPAPALPLLERYVADVPDDAEGHAQLGLCRLAMADAAAALDSLGRATWLEPEQPLHHWNAAAAAHRAGRMGACYLELEAYRQTRERDVAPGAEVRGAIAERFADEYARLAVLEHPGASPRAVASAEDTRRRGGGRSRSRRRQRG
ncbi:MAG TPA: hypothetical protein VKB80_32840 [Kofleriaceae bacterium]|nr:hypothetical protein [Kofleriaceae bacterium]